jgi:hypothetical protein
MTLYTIALNSIAMANRRASRASRIQAIERKMKTITSPIGVLGASFAYLALNLSAHDGR